MTQAQKLAEELRAKRAKQKEFLDAHKDADGNYDMTPQEHETLLAEFKAIGDLDDAWRKAHELESLASNNESELKGLESVDEGGRLGIGGDVRTVEAYKSIGERIVESEEFKAYDPHSRSGRFSLELDVEDMSDRDPREMKTLLTTSTGMPVQTPVTTEIFATPRRRLVVADLIPQSSIATPMATWMEQTTDTNSAATVAEAGTKPESAAAWTLRSATATKIADSIPVTTEQLEDVPGMTQMINRFLNGNILFAEEVQLLNGDGNAPNMLGLTQMPNILTQARGSDNNVDAIFKLFTQIRSTGTGSVFAEPSGAVMHPTNWQTVRLMKTSDGAYLWGPPSEDGTTRVWGKPVVVTPAITANTALTGDFAMYSRLRRYKTIRFEVGYVNDQFIKNQKTFLAEERIILQVIFQKAFGLATGLN